MDLLELASRSLELIRPKFAEKGIQVEKNIPNGNYEVLADPEKLAQVLRNLLQNAWQYTPTGGKVRITIERSPTWIRWIFANTGEGITNEDLPFIFERFYRGEKSRSRQHGGAGIGLAIVKELIEAHGGQVSAESSTDETRVWFSLPL